SMMRTSGAMLTITARQMATASLAVPKSVINTMVGLAADGEPASFSAGALEHAAAIKAIPSNGKPSSRRRELMKSPLKLNELNGQQCNARGFHPQTSTRLDEEQSELGGQLTFRKARSKRGRSEERR